MNAIFLSFFILKNKIQELKKAAFLLVLQCFQFSVSLHFLFFPLLFSHIIAEKTEGWDEARIRKKVSEEKKNILKSNFYFELEMMAAKSTNNTKTPLLFSFMKICEFCF